MNEGVKFERGDRIETVLYGARLRGTVLYQRKGFDSSLLVVRWDNSPQSQHVSAHTIRKLTIVDEAAELAGDLDRSPASGQPPY